MRRQSAEESVIKIVDEYSHHFDAAVYAAMSKMAYTKIIPKGTIDDYEVRRLGKKHYGIYQRRSIGGWTYDYLKALAIYRCSHIEAKRRWTATLVTHRLMR